MDNIIELELDPDNHDPSLGKKNIYDWIKKTGLLSGKSNNINPIHNFFLLKEHRFKKYEEEKQKHINRCKLYGIESNETDLKTHFLTWLEKESHLVFEWNKGQDMTVHLELKKYLFFLHEEYSKCQKKEVKQDNISWQSAFRDKAKGDNIFKLLSNHLPLHEANNVATHFLAILITLSKDKGGNYLKDNIHSKSFKSWASIVNKQFNQNIDPNSFSQQKNSAKLPDLIEEYKRIFKKI